VSSYSGQDNKRADCDLSISTLLPSAPILLGMGREIGVRLRHARKSRGISQEKLAKAIGVKQAAISQLETGESKSFRGTTLVSIAQTLKVSPDWLATGKGPMDGHHEPLPADAERVARDWLLLTPQVRSRVAAMIRTMVETSHGDLEAAPDEKVAAAYGKPGNKSVRKS
jgi:transcriptional regulator with XRE-family HTH domain